MGRRRPAHVTPPARRVATETRPGTAAAMRSTSGAPGERTRQGGPSATMMAGQACFQNEACSEDRAPGSHEGRAKARALMREAG